MASYERSYGTARMVFGILEFSAKLVILGGVISLVVGLTSMEEMRSQSDAFMVFGGIVAGIFFAFIGLISVAFVQTNRCIVDQTEMTRDMLGLMRKSGGKPSGGRQEIDPSVTGVDAGTVIKAHRGYQIVKHEDGVSVSGSVFKNVLEAEEFINGMEVNR